MTGHSRRGYLRPGEMFPAGDPGYRVSFPRLRSGIRVRVVEKGNVSAPPVLMIHGWGCSAYIFRENMPAVAEAGFRAIALDLKGHGLSDKPQRASEYTIDSLVDHVKDVIDALKLERPVLVGHSLGASLIYHFASRHSERVRALALLSPVGLTGVPLLRLYHLLTPAFMTPVMCRVKPTLIVKAALHRVYGKRGRPTSRDVEEYLAPAQFREYAGAVRALLHSYDWWAARNRPLTAVNLPAIGRWGTLDHLMPKDGMAIYVPLIPGIDLAFIRDAGHVITEETPHEVNVGLIDLLKRVHDNPSAGAASQGDDNAADILTG
ncbi:MAG TPA: alpha/beta hydrolase [Gemmatimonadaceae bacterium]|nr:alpha/beta hydrolase [Gemmatimonadaceae bacterium]